MTIGGSLIRGVPEPDEPRIRPFPDVDTAACMPPYGTCPGSLPDGPGRKESNAVSQWAAATAMVERQVAVTRPPPHHTFHLTSHLLRTGKASGEEPGAGARPSRGQKGDVCLGDAMQEMQGSGPESEIPGIRTGARPEPTATGRREKRVTREETPPRRRL